MVHTQFANWRDVKAKARQIDPRTPEQRQIGKQQAAERQAAYLRGHQLAEIRKTIGLTQTALAEKLGVSQTRISKIESGEISGIDTIRAYIAALGGSVDMVATLGDRTWKVA